LSRKLLILAVLVAAVFAVPALAATTTTHLKDDKFTKSRLTVTKGTVVEWTWKTHHKHTVTEISGKWGSKMTRTGSFKHRFRKRGKFTVYCLVHPVDMRQRIVVK
jgi:plastocyanin